MFTTDKPVYLVIKSEKDAPVNLKELSMVSSTSSLYCVSLIFPSLSDAAKAHNVCDSQESKSRQVSTSLLVVSDIKISPFGKVFISSSLFAKTIPVSFSILCKHS